MIIIKGRHMYIRKEDFSYFEGLYYEDRR
jgi:hypothetical protein